MDRFLLDLKDRTDIVSVIGKYAEVKKSGKNYTCKSPFRNERTPSFSIDADRGVWYDFGASEGGDVIRFIEKIENLNFREAVEHLADLNGMQVPKSSFKEKKKSQKEQDEKEKGYALHAEATKYFQQQLEANPDAKNYLQNRGMTPQTIKKWQIGYGGEKKDGLARHLVAQGFKPKAIEAYGLAMTSSFGEKSLKDRFVGRIITPIHEPRDGKVIGFSCRTHNKAKAIKPEAKYINSPEHALYKKSKTLFGLHHARQLARKKEEIVIAEGNFDVISAHQAGLATTVATCGTSLTDDHLRIIKRITKNVILAFDNDQAGKKATLRGTEMLMKAEMNPKIMDMGQMQTNAKGLAIKDLDELAQNAPEELKTKIKAATPALVFFAEAFAKKILQQNVKNLKNNKPADLTAQKKYLEANFYFLRLSQSPLEVESLLEKYATTIKKPLGVIRAEFESYKSKKPKTKDRFVPETTREVFGAGLMMLGFASLHWEMLENETKTALQKGLEAILDKEALDLLQKLAKNDLSDDEKVRIAACEMLQPGMVSKPNAEILNWAKKQIEKAEKRQKINALVDKVWEG